MGLFEVITGAGGHSPVGEFGLLAQFNGPGFSSGPPAFVTVFMVLFVLVFVLVIGTIIFRIGKGVSEWSENNEQPVLTVPAKVVAKRADLSVYSNRSGNNNLGTSSSTAYYATFEFSSGDRKEFSLSAPEFGLLSENDTGQLTFQGTRFKSFQRHNDEAKTAIAPEPSEAATVSETASARPASAHSFCPYCGVEIQGTFKFCPHCGKEQPIYDASA